MYLQLDASWDLFDVILNLVVTVFQGITDNFISVMVEMVSSFAGGTSIAVVGMVLVMAMTTLGILKHTGGI